MKDVEAAVLAAQDKYERGNKKPKMQTWLGRCASRIVHYGNIMDVLVQHHPEYVSLAWGTMKFLFVVSLHHAYCSQERADPLSNSTTPSIDMV